MKKTGESYYDYWANQYILSNKGTKLKLWVEKTYLKFLLKTLKRNSLQNITMLEIGPGKGYFAHIAIASGVEYYAVEASKTLYNELKKQRIRVECKTFNSRTRCFKGKKFDIIYISHVLEHCDTRKDAVDLIKGAYSQLKKGGVIMLNSPNVLNHKFLFYLADYSHNFVTTPLRIRNLLIDQGFKPLVIYKTTFGISNWILRKFISFVFKIIPAWLLNIIGKKFIPGSEGGLEVFGCENFSIIAKKI